MSDFRRDFETVEEARKRLASEDQADEPEAETVLKETARVPLVVKPGHARQAFKAGREDEYSDRMRAKYGGEW